MEANLKRDGELSLERVGADASSRVLEILARSPEYFQRVEGAIPTEEIAHEEITGSPKKTGIDYRNCFYVLQEGGKDVGVVSLHVNHPESGIVYLGLLLIVESEFGRGLGRRFYAVIEEHCRKIYGATRMRIGINDANDVTPFWAKLGFVPNGRTYEWRGNAKVTHVKEFDKTLHVY